MLELRTEEREGVRIIGSWMREKKNVRNRIKRAGMLYGNVKRWLKESRLSKR